MTRQIMLITIIIITTNDNFYQWGADMLLSDCQTGTTAKITTLSMVDSVRKRLMDLGLLPGTKIQVVRKAPLGDPIVIQVRGYQVSFRLSEAACIEIDAAH